MPIAVRISFVLCVLLVPAARAQSPVVADTSALEFLGFRAGAHLSEVGARIRELDGGRLRCDRAKADRRVTECRATLTDPATALPVDLWLSAIDSLAGVMTLSGEVEGDELDRWRGGIERRYGRVGAQVQGTQWMMQWVRRGRMMRLTWRMERGERVASVSLVDGRVLDGWGRARSRAGSR